MFSYFKGATVFTLVCLGLAVWLGWSTTGTLGGTLGVLWIVAVLGVLEVSLSFDNAVVNATVLKDMSQVWRQRFLTWGIAFAVFGMRIVFPLAIVAIAAQVGPIEAIRLAASDPEEYERIITGAHVGISGFGGAFLAMVGLKFFFDSDKEVHWIHVVEKRLSRFSNVEALEIGVVLLALLGISRLLTPEDGATFVTSGLWGLLAFVAVEAVGHVLEPPKADDAEHAGQNGVDLTAAAAKSGLSGFLYLNVLDSAFSFDGVIGAFALSNNIFVIALGLGIGAMFVRSMTIMLVDRGTLAQYRYLEHGAFWAILVLAAILLFGARFHIPEVFTGLVGAVLIGLSLWASARYNRSHPDEAAMTIGGSETGGVLPDGKRQGA